MSENTIILSYYIKSYAYELGSIPRVMLKSIESASVEGGKDMAPANASRFRHFFESLGKQLAEKRQIK